MRLIAVALTLGALLACNRQAGTGDDRAFCRELRVGLEVLRAGGSKPDSNERLHTLADEIDDDQLADHAAEALAFSEVPEPNRQTRATARAALALVVVDCERLGEPVDE